MTASRARDRRIGAALARWFLQTARPLPWRTTPRDPYRSLVSEAMLQQTQVSRVIERFEAFVARFPTVTSLAAASEDDVLALWSGLGYYRRARNLHGAAREIVERFGGRVPSELDELLSLPGVGRYTAGAVASMVFDAPVPLVDGNVARVLQRLDAHPGSSSEPPVQRWAWDRATSLIEASTSGPAPTRSRPALVNEALMELGALVCLPPPRTPRCGECPLAATCRARRDGLTPEIPSPKARPEGSVLHAAAVVVRRESKRGVELLVQKRPGEGMWAGLWQAPTLERSDRPSTGAEISRAFRVLGPRQAGEFTHKTTHRRVEFAVWTARAGAKAVEGIEWRTLEDLAETALSSPQRRIVLGFAEGPGARKRVRP